MSGELRLFDDESKASPEPVIPKPTTAHATVPPTISPIISPTSEPSIAPFAIKLERSSKRRRTVGAQLVGDVLTIIVPSWMSRSEQDHWTHVMSRRFQRSLSTGRIDLVKRSDTLSRRHGLPRPTIIQWSDDMHARWGSCTLSTGSIRISSRIAKFPDWVIDYVLVHELAHLAVAAHSDAFWQLVRRYPRAERAIGYLIAKSGEDCDD